MSTTELVASHAPPRNDRRKAAPSGFLGSWTVSGAEAQTSPFGGGLGAELPLSEIDAALAPFHALQIADVVDAIRSGREPAIPRREATKSLAILAALYASAKSGRPEPPALVEVRS
jgi:UDP-N-acetyl-2-amino-2-deoxyglucuronate dehydrogenase